MLVAVGLWLVIVEVPGFAVLRMLRIPGSLGSLLALAAPISFGYIYLVGAAATRLGVSVMSAGLAALGVLAVAWILAEIVRFAPAARRSTPETADRWGHLGAVCGLRISSRRSSAGWRQPSRACSRALVVLAIGGGAALWNTLHDGLTVPAGWDAMHHGYFVKQIVEHDTLSPGVVLSSDSSQSDATGSFYPLAVNLVTALLHVSTGIRISVLILASTTALAGVILPLGVYVLCRRLAPELPLVAGFAALASVLPATLFGIEFSGRITGIIGIALVPAAVGAILSLGDRLDWRAVPVGILTLVGLIDVHTSEVPVVIGLVLAAALVNAWLLRRWTASARWLAYLAGIGMVAVLIMLASEPAIRHVVGQRTGAFVAGSGWHASLPNAVRAFALARTPSSTAASRPMQAWALLALLGCVMTLHRSWRRLLPAAVGYAAFGVFYVAWLSDRLGPFLALADVWYRDSGRMLWEVILLGTIPVGVALAGTASVVRRGVHYLLVRVTRMGLLGPPREIPVCGRSDGALLSPGRRWASTVVAVIAVASGVATFMLPPVRQISQVLRLNSPVDADSQSAFRFLADHVGRGERVLDDLENHGDLWMYADFGVPTVFGNPPLIGSAPTSWKERLYLRGELRHLASDGCVRHFLAAYRVSYVYYADRFMYNGTPRIPLSTLRDHRYFEEAFASGASRVFKVRPPDARAYCDHDVTAVFPWSSLHNAK